jgi:hypothetical protein
VVVVVITASFYRKKLFARRSFHAHSTGIAAPKPELGAKAEKNIVDALFIERLGSKSLEPKCRDGCGLRSFSSRTRPL